MKKILIIFFATFCLYNISASAQQGYKAVYFAGGLTYEKGANFLVGIDFPNNYFNSFEIFLQGYFTGEEDNYLAGIGYKYSFFKGINSMFRGKLAGAIGTTTHKTVFAPIGGFEYIYSISPTIDLMGLVDGGYYFKSNQAWRINAFAGIRFNF